MPNRHISYAFFGTGPLAESVLASLHRAGIFPSLVITKPDSPQGRHMEITPPYIKLWAQMKDIEVLQPEKFDEEFLAMLSRKKFDVFIVASYGKIIPASLLGLPKHGVLNIHPSLLPLYRGPSPIEQALLDGVMTTGVSVMKLDSKLDHGPILAQNAFIIPQDITLATLEVMMGQAGGELLTQVLQPYLDGTLIPKEQEHEKATFSKKITKELGQINLDTDAETVRRKYRALTPWPSVYFFHEHAGKKIRVKVTKVDLVKPLISSANAAEIILSVIPEGKKEMSWDSFVLGYMK